MPITAPPVSCHEVSLAPQYFAEYDQALNNYLNDPKLKRKFERDLPLSPAEKQVMDKIREAENRVYEYGVTLFSAALLSENPAPDKVLLWENFAERILKRPISLTRSNTLLLLADPKISIADRQLLLDYCTNPSGEVKPELAKRFNEHYRAVGNDYNGWQGGEYYSGGEAFIGVLAEMLGPYDFEKLGSRLIGRDPKKYLVRLNDLEIDQYFALDKHSFFSRYETVRKDHLRTAPGHLKALLFRRARDLEAIALARGFSLEAFQREDFARSLPGLSENEVDSLQLLSYYSQHIGGRTLPTYQQIFMATLARFVEAYHRAPADRKTYYASALQQLDNLSFDFGLSAQRLDQEFDLICRRLSCALKPEGKVGNLADLKDLNGIAVPPEGLPAEIKEVLIKTGYWELVRHNIHNVTFTPKINLGNGIAALEAAGLAVPILKRVEIDFTQPDGSITEAWEIAAVLVHEAAHVAWRKFPAILQQSTPNERNAFAAKYHFLNKYGTVFGRTKELQDAQDLCHKAVRSANQVLGYGPDDLDMNISLPSQSFCRGFGVAGPKELDLSFYPAFPGPAYLVDRAQLASRLGAPARTIGPKVLDIFASLLNDRAVLEIRAAFRGEQVQSGPELTLELEGQSHKLTKRETETLAGLLAGAVENPEWAEKLTGPYDPLLAAGNYQDAKTSPVDGPQLREALQSAIRIDLKELVRRAKTDNLEYNLDSVSSRLGSDLVSFSRTAGTLGERLGMDALTVMLESLSLVKKIAQRPELMSSIRVLAQSPLIKAADRAKYVVALKLFTALNRLVKTREEKLALIDLVFAQIDLTLGKKITTTSHYQMTGVSLREFLFFAGR